MAADSKGNVLGSRNEFFIGGQWVRPASDRRFTLVNASTEEIMGTVPEAVEADIDAAVAAARQALTNSAWTTMTPADRAQAMLRFADALARRIDDTARAVSAQNGMPLSLSGVFEGQFPVGLLQY